jgi:septum formation protein
MGERHKLILASQSPRRSALLARIGIIPDLISPADINEDIIQGELPRDYVSRLACEKATKISGDFPNYIVLAADTAVAIGRRILPKAETIADAKYCLQLISGRSHRVFTCVAVVKSNGDILKRVVETRLKMKRLSESELKDYIHSQEWQGKAGGYSIQGSAESFVIKIVGSYSNVVGLPLYETRNMLRGSGYIL